MSVNNANFTVYTRAPYRKIAASPLPTHQATSITCHSCLALGLSSTTSTGWRGHTPWGGHLARSYTGREAVCERDHGAVPICCHMSNLQSDWCYTISCSGK